MVLTCPPKTSAARRQLLLVLNVRGEAVMRRSDLSDELHSGSIPRRPSPDNALAWSQEPNGPWPAGRLRISQRDPVRRGPASAQSPAQRLFLRLTRETAPESPPVPGPARGEISSSMPPCAGCRSFRLRG